MGDVIAVSYALYLPIMSLLADGLDYDPVTLTLNGMSSDA